MKSIRSLAAILSILSVLLVPLVLSSNASAAETKKVAGPNGGRIIATVTPRAEFFVTADRKVQITFLDDAGKAIAPAEQVVTVTTGDRSAPKSLTFAQAGNTLLSTSALPAGNDLPAVVQIKANATAKPITAKFTLDLNKCGECKLAEYACTCAH